MNDYIKKKQISKYSKKNLIFLSNKKMAFEVSKKRKQQLVESQLQSYSKSFEQRIEAGFDEYEIVEHRDEIAFEDGFTDYMEYIYTVDDDNPVGITISHLSHLFDVLLVNDCTGAVGF